MMLDISVQKIEKPSSHGKHEGRRRSTITWNEIDKNEFESLILK